jgi:hypothetical protein
MSYHVGVKDYLGLQFTTGGTHPAKQRRMRFAGSTCALLLLGCSSPPVEQGYDAQESSKYVSASSVEALNGDLSSVDPPVERLFANDPLRPEDYLKPMSCLGYYGPIGPWGPLALLGPVGDAVWNPSQYVSGDDSVAWSGWAETIDDVDGPLSADGPLGKNGPLGDAYWETLPELNDFGKQLQGGGVWTVLGPLGPLGPLGALGPLGPVGAHGLTASDSGEYVDDGGDVIRTVKVPWEGSETRTYELYENYTAEQAQSMTDNDTSFMVSSRGRRGEAQEFSMRSREAQRVTIVVVPESASMFYPQAMSVLFAAAVIGYNIPPVAPAFVYTTDDFDLEVLRDGELVAESNSAERIDWIQLSAPRDSDLVVRVTLVSSWDSWSLSPISRRYRLFVTGSTKHLRESDIRGDHQVSL